jgi:hypothetical protein
LGVIFRRIEACRNEIRSQLPPFYSIQYGVQPDLDTRRPAALAPE